MALCWTPFSGILAIHFLPRPRFLIFWKKLISLELAGERHTSDFILFLKVGEQRQRGHKVCYPKRQRHLALAVGREPRLPSSGTEQCYLSL